ncbi:MAG: DUF2071 domain-containing protein [Kofleriaceae bacterium]|nr:DUF2071 domain-containing protein [Kofleriaceae bacterium]
MASALELDRLAPCTRPDARVAGTQKWRELLFLHWTCPVDVMRPLVPAELELDTWDGRAWIGLVPFIMRDIRSAWMPRRLGLDFLETNVRTYVHHRGVPGIYFFSLEASSWLAVQVARRAWSLPYFHASMHTARTADEIVYRCTRKQGDRPYVEAQWQLGELLGPSAPGTLEHFLLERYILFSERRGRLLKGQVHHAPYPAQRATVANVKQTLISAAGMPLDPRAIPETVHYAEGVDVEVFGPWLCDTIRA